MEVKTKEERLRVKMAKKEFMISCMREQVGVRENKIDQSN